ncbi:unnamed protein product [Ascophyllum nodosum]
MATTREHPVPAYESDFMASVRVRPLGWVSLKKREVRPTAVEIALKMLKRVEFATEGRTSSASKTLVMKANVVFGISDNNGEHKEGKSAKIWTGGSVDGSTWRTG